MAVCMAADRGYLSYDDPVAKHWPDFAAEDKDAITIADVLRHDSGLHRCDNTTFDDIKSGTDVAGSMAAKLSAQKSEFLPHTQRIYHAMTRGWILSQILQRCDPKGRTVGRFISEEIAGPLGVDFHVGMSHEFQAEKVFAELHQMPGRFKFVNTRLPAILKFATGTMTVEQAVALETTKDPSSVANVANPSFLDGSPNFFQSSHGRAVEIGSANGQANARAMAKIMAVLANGGSLDGVTLLSPKGLARALDKPIEAHMAGIEMPTTFVQGGWNKFGPALYGWGGWGGSLMLFDPVNNFAIGYAMTAMGEGTTGDVRMAGPMAGLRGGTAKARL